MTEETQLEFEPGELVHVIMIAPLPGNNVAPPLKMNQEVKIESIFTCKCGQRHINVNLKSNYNYISCYKCKQELPQSDTIHWCHPTRFAKN